MPVEPTAATTRRGTLVTFEGIDGCGKSTQVELVARMFENAGISCVRLREPGGTAISEDIRAMLLDPSNAEMCDECELLLYEASRAQLVRQVIEPELAAGTLVVCDRFYDSTYAYQVGGRGLASDLVARANALGSCGLVPDLTVVLDLDPFESLARATEGGADRLEGEGLAFQRRVREAYLRLAAAEPSRVRLVDASGTVDEVHAHVADVIAGVVPELRGCGTDA